MCTSDESRLQSDFPMKLSFNFYNVKNNICFFSTVCLSFKILVLGEAGLRRLGSRWPWRNYYEHNVQSPSPRTIPGSPGGFFFFPKLITTELISGTKRSTPTNVAPSTSLATTLLTYGNKDKTLVLYKKLPKYSPIDPPCFSGFGEEEISVGKLLKPLSPHCHVELAALQPTAFGHWGAFVGVEAGQHMVNDSLTTLELQI